MQDFALASFGKFPGYTWIPSREGAKPPATTRARPLVVRGSASASVARSRTPNAYREVHPSARNPGYAYTWFKLVQTAVRWEKMCQAVFCYAKLISEHSGLPVVVVVYSGLCSLYYGFRMHMR